MSGTAYVVRRWKRTMRVLAPAQALLLAIALSAMPWPAEARPGTPVSVVLADCTGYPYQGSGRQFIDAPAVCVTFTNTAPERVRFEYELTINDLPASTRGLTAHCRVMPMVCGPAISALNGRGDYTERTSDRPNWGDTGFLLVELDYGTRYCLRVRTRDDDDMVSLRWSNWACVRTRARPAAPQAPTVEVTPSRRGDQIRVAWSGGGDVGYYRVEGRTSRPVNVSLVPSAFLDAERNRRLPTTNGFTLDIPWGVAADMEGEAYYYRVCAVNLVRESCSEWASSLGDQLPLSERLQHGAHGGPVRIPVPPGPPVRVQNPEPFVVNAPVCRSGFVWRQARPQDTVCVSPQSRAAAAAENAGAASRVNSSGDHGRATCITGYVWREAYEGDVVCVTPERRDEVRQENQLAASRVIW